MVNYYGVFYDRPDLIHGAMRSSTFARIHNCIGDGPVLLSTINSGLRSYVNSRPGFFYTGGGNGRYAKIKSKIESGQICMILLFADLVNWHYVIGVGYREYTDGSKFIRVVDNWHNSSNKYIYSRNLVGSYYMHISETVPLQRDYK